MSQEDLDLLAAVGVRVCLDFEPYQKIPNNIEALLIEWRMRVAFSIHQHGQYLISGYPSEPLIAMAATLFMSDHAESGKETIAQFLREPTSRGLISTGDHGEVVARLLLVLAQDKAQRLQEQSTFVYSKPVSVASFFEALLEQRKME